MNFPNLKVKQIKDFDCCFWQRDTCLFVKFVNLIEENSKGLSNQNYKYAYDKEEGGIQ